MVTTGVRFDLIKIGLELPHKRGVSSWKIGQRPAITFCLGQ
jgi:hypothetical protein